MNQESVKIAITKADGSVAIMTFLTVGRGDILPSGATWIDQTAGYWRREPNATNLMNEITRSCAVGPKMTKFRLISEDDIPEDRTFRDALIDPGDGKLSHDMPRAREIHREKMRVARGPLLAALDVDLMRADEDKSMAAGLRKASIIERKQALRDVTDDPRIEAASTTEELKEVWPEALVE